jgi:aarF domain-containing kinase
MCHRLQSRIPSEQLEAAGVSASLTDLQAAKVFSELTPEPVASASLGQVYRGRLITTGQEVAVKVQRPRIGESIAMDMLLLRRLMAAVDRYLPQVGCLSSPCMLCAVQDELLAAGS